MAPTSDQIEVSGADITTFTVGPGTGFHIVSALGLDSLPMKPSDVDLLGDGVYFGIDRAAKKDIVLTINVEAGTAAGLQTKLDQFAAAWAPGGDKTLAWNRRGATRSVTGRTRDYEVDEARSILLSLDIVAHFVANPTITVVP